MGRHCWNIHLCDPKALLEYTFIRSKGTAPWVVTLRRGSFHYKACLLFNSTPRWVREIKEGTVEAFKGKLNKYLACVPDCPRDSSGGFYPKAYDRDTQTPSNSLIHWGSYLREIRPDWDW